MTKFLNLKNYIKYFLKHIVALIVSIIKIWEDRYIRKYSKQPLKHQPVFIIGAPRTGSTILYQTLTNQLDVLYIDNLTCKFNKNLFFGFWLSNKIFKQKAHNCFKSNHGNTLACGLHAPSECGGFWYRWLPRDRHFIDHNDITEEMITCIRNEITAVINYFKKPLVFKNLNAGQRLRLLKQCFPKAKFIFIKREPIFTAQSILNAKRKVGIKDNKLWSIIPKNYQEIEELNSYEQIIKQIFYIEKQIIEDSKLFLQDSFLFLNYKELGTDFNITVHKCQKFINVEDKINFQKADVKLTEKLTLDDIEIDKFTKEIKKLDWENYNV